MKRVSLLLLLCLAPVLVSKAQLPCDSIEASLITCSPGDEVYSLYGHTALRCRNFTRKADVAFNYGVFSFGQPHFLWRFILGQCDYMVLGIPWDVFIKEYEERGSRVTQQTLNLTSEEANRLWAYLVVNCLPENRKYRYNYFYNNCTTQVRDMIERAVMGSVTYAEDSSRSDATYRDLIHSYTQCYPWTGEGCDILLGADADRVASPRASQFLPEVLMQNMEHASVSDENGMVRPLLLRTEILLHERPRAEQHGLMSPAVAGWTFVFLSLLLVGYEVWRRCWLWVWDVILLLARGLSGSLLTFMALFSEHPAVDSNWLVVLLNPLAFVGLFLVIRAAFRRSQTRWFAFDSANLLLFAVIFLLGMQKFGELIVPLTLAFAARPLSRYVRMRRATTKI